MQKYKLLIFGMVLLLFASFGLAAQEDVDDPTMYFGDGDTDLTGNGNDIYIRNTGDAWNIGFAKLGTHGLLSGGGVSLIQDSTDFNLGSNDFTIAFWLNATSAGSDVQLFTHGNTTSNYMKITIGDGLGIYLRDFVGGPETFEAKWAVDYRGTYEGDSALMVITRATDKCQMWIDGVDKGYSTNETDTCGYFFPDQVGDWSIGADVNDAVAQGLASGESWDEFGLWNGYAFTQADVDILYNSGAGYRPSFAGPTPEINSLNLSTPNPLADESFNVATLNFNTTVNSTAEFNCSFYVNNTLNQTTNEYPSGEDIAVDFNVTFVEDGAFNYSFQCWNGINETNTTPTNFFMDFEDPAIVTNFVNNSLYFIDFLTGQWNFTDNILLHTFNISIDDILLNSTVHIHQTNFQYNLSRNVTNLTAGLHNITVFITDGHTASSLKQDYEWKNGLFNDYLEYTLPSGNYVRTELKDSSLFDSWTTTRLFDRYTQTLVPNNPSDTIVLVEESDDEIFIVNKPGHYNGQWIIIGNHWKDYVLKDEPNAVVSIKRISKYEVEVTISGIKNTERLEFESIGDLNILEVNYGFYVSGAKETFSSSVLEFENQVMSFRMNKSVGITTDAQLFYNGTERTVSTTDFTTYDLYSASFTTPEIDLIQDNITFYWQYDFTGPVDNEVGNLTFNQSVNSIGFDNCTTYTARAINFSVRNETDSSLIIDNSTTIQGYFKAWKSSESNFTEFNLTWGGQNQNDTLIYGLCIDPADANYTMDAQLEYDATGFEKKLYYLNDYAIDNSTNLIDLFLTDGTTQVELTVKDFDDSVVDNAVIKVLSYDIATDSSTTTEIVETDSNGQAFVQLVLNTEWYVFIVEVDGVVKLQTIPTKITSTTKTLRIDLSDIRYFDRYDVTRGITHSLTWTNATNTFTFTWSDPSGDIVDACLKVSEKAVNLNKLLSDTCTTSVAGTRTYTIVGNITDQTYVAVSYVKFSDTEIYILKTLVQSFEETFKKFGLTGIFVSFLLVLTLIGVGINHPVMAILLGIFGLIVVTILGVFAVQWGVLMGLIIMGGILLYKLTRN